MPEQSPYPNESKEDYKERIKKLKAKTSKMRLAFVGPGYKAPKGFIPDLSPENMKKINNIGPALDKNGRPLQAPPYKEYQEQLKKKALKSQ